MQRVQRPDKISCKIGPSILNADLCNLYEESTKLIQSGADYLHLDVMDGHFVPNITFGAPVVKCLRNKLKTAFFETHMMVQNPDQWINDMADAHVDQYVFHIEASGDAGKTIRKIKEASMLAGLAINPRTSVDEIKTFIDFVDMVLVMTVEPGFGGQSFMASMMPKVAWLRKNHPNLHIEVDGGVHTGTIEHCAKAGANCIVSGTGIIKADSPKRVIQEMRDVVQSYLK